MITVVEVDGDLVLMDTEADAYLCIGRDRMPDDLNTDDVVDEPAVCTAAEHLAKAGVGPTQWKWADPSLIRERHDMLRLGTADPRLIVGSIPAMIAAGVTSMLRLRGPIARYRGRADRSHDADRAKTAEQSRIGAIVAVFDAFRPFVPCLGRCLPYSLYLRDFLGLHGISATLVFGVRTHPFEAHCWVERDGCVLNDTADHVAWFTPIYAC